MCRSARSVQYWRHMTRKPADAFSKGSADFAHTPFARLAKEPQLAPMAPSPAPTRATVPPRRNQSAPPPRVAVYHESVGRSGKVVTRITGLPHDLLETVASRLSKALGCVAQVNDAGVMLEGGLKERASEWLQKIGDVRKLADEKPAPAKAKRYLAAGNYYWNSGMFFWRAGVLLEELRRGLPKTATLLASLPAFGDRHFAARLKQVFPLCENISIDFAVMEKSDNVAGIAAADFGWNDVGSWNAVYELLVRDGHGNSIGPDSVCLDSHNNFVDARGKLVALLGVRNLIVVDTPDALLVASRSRAQQVGDIVKALEKLNRQDLL